MSVSWVAEAYMKNPVAIELVDGLREGVWVGGGCELTVADTGNTADLCDCTNAGVFDIMLCGFYLSTLDPALRVLARDLQIE